MEQINKFGAQQMGTVQTMAAKSNFSNWKKERKRSRNSEVPTESSFI